MKSSTRCHLIKFISNFFFTRGSDNDNDNDKVFDSTLIIHFISHITVINAFAY